MIQKNKTFVTYAGPFRSLTPQKINPMIVHLCSHLDSVECLRVDGVLGVLVLIVAPVVKVQQLLVELDGWRVPRKPSW